MYSYHATPNVDLYPKPDVDLYQAKKSRFTHCRTWTDSAGDKNAGDGCGNEYTFKSDVAEAAFSDLLAKPLKP